MENKEIYSGTSHLKPPGKPSGFSACPHGIIKNEFPSRDKCYRKDLVAPGGYEALCSHCRIWLLYRVGTLKISRFFDCDIRDNA